MKTRNLLFLIRCLLHSSFSMGICWINQLFYEIVLDYLIWLCSIMTLILNIHLKNSNSLIECIEWVKWLYFKVENNHSKYSGYFHQNSSLNTVAIFLMYILGLTCQFLPGRLLGSLLRLYWIYNQFGEYWPFNNNWDF